jgi:hypothetical protein
MVGMTEKWRKLAKLRAEEGIVEGVVAAAEVRVGREK